MTTNPIAPGRFPLGYSTAKRVLELGRGEFFGTHSTDLPQRRSAEVSADDLLPQFGYVGDGYIATRVLILGINPGNGSDVTRSDSDKFQMLALGKFVRDRTPESFLEAQRAYRQVCQSWPIWRRHCSEVIGAGLLTLDDVAYSNCLPWRTASESGFDDDISRRTATLYAYPLIDELAPEVVIAMGKKAAAILALGGRRLSNVITWNRAQAATAPVNEERAAAAKKIFKILERRRRGDQ